MTSFGDGLLPGVASRTARRAAPPRRWIPCALDSRDQGAAAGELRYAVW